MVAGEPAQRERQARLHVPQLRERGGLAAVGHRPLRRPVGADVHPVEPPALTWERRSRASTACLAFCLRSLRRSGNPDFWRNDRFTRTGQPAPSNKTFGADRIPTLRENLLAFPKHGINLSPRCRTLSSVVEHYLHTVGVAGSKPAASTIPPFRVPLRQAVINRAIQAVFSRFYVIQTHRQL